MSAANLMLSCSRSVGGALTKQPQHKASYFKHTAQDAPPPTFPRETHDAQDTYGGAQPSNNIQVIVFLIPCTQITSLVHSPLVGLGWHNPGIATFSSSAAKGADKLVQQG